MKQPTPAEVATEELDVAEPTPIAAAARSFLAREGGQWKFRVDRRTGKPSLVQGSGIPMVPGRGNALTDEVLSGLPMPDGKLGVATLAPLAGEFIELNAALMKPAVGSLELDESASSVRDKGRLASLYYQWQIDGVPVEGAYAFVRLNSGNVTQFGAPLVGDAGIATRPGISREDALKLLMNFTGDGEVHTQIGDTELLIQPENESQGDLSYRLVWKITYSVPGRIETWEGRLDAQTGDVVSFVDTNHYMRAVGGVYPRTVLDQNETRVPMPLVDIDLDGSPITSAASGAFAYSGETAISGLNGQWFNTSCQGCSNPSQPDVRVDLGIGWLDFGFGGLDEVGNGQSTPADRNTFFHLNQVRRIAKYWLPNEPWIDIPMTSNINITNTCNAVYSSGANTVNFYRSGPAGSPSECNNTGEISDVVHHEWGHGLDINTRSGPGETGEGSADTVAFHMSHGPQIGPGFRKTGAPVRNVDSQVTGLITLSNHDGFCGSGTHCGGQVYGQSGWDLAKTLRGKYGHHTGWRTSERLFFTSLPDAGSLRPTDSFPIFDAYIQADDDDGNLANGTPNGVEIYEAFNTHEIATGITNSSLPCSRPEQPNVFVTPSCEQFDISWTPIPGASDYLVLRGEVREDQAFFPIAELDAAQTSYVDTDVAEGVDYYYVVMALNLVGCESTIESPVHAKLDAQPVLTVTAAANDDTPRGNRSGFPDPGEEVDLTLTLKNVGTEPATAVTGTIVSTTPGVTILDGAVNWPAVPAGNSVASEQILRFEADDQQVVCGQAVQFQFIPDDFTGCADEVSYFEVVMGEFDGGQYVCDPTPACFTKPDFDGLASAAPGASCGEAALTWAAAISSCSNATLSYNVYRDTAPGFSPGPGNLVASGVAGTGFTDTLLDPGTQLYYVVRAFDSRSGEEENTVELGAVPPQTPDIQSPVFGGIEGASTAEDCGGTLLNWSAALETCNTPVSYEIYRSTDSGFVPGPATKIGSTLDLSFADVALTPGDSFTYVVRARDGMANEGTNDVRLTIDAGLLDAVKAQTEFEPDDAGWSAVAPNDASTGNWEWGDPVATSYQPENDATELGTQCWITGVGPTPSNNDVDGGTTTLLTSAYDMSGTVNPTLRFARWFNNNRGAGPNEASDALLIEVSDDNGTSWQQLDLISCPDNNACPLDWIDVEYPLSLLIGPSAAETRFRFTAADLGDGSLVEAGVDDFRLVDVGQGCVGCPLPVQKVTTIQVSLSGEDVVLDWTADPVAGDKYVVYKLTGPQLDVPLRIGTVEGKTFVHEGAAPAAESFRYRVSAVDDCGNESGLE
ncbi:MAG: hypothetical protein GY716_16495 [bacterium]|nr:hypothetical protein [bacterium]